MPDSFTVLNVCTGNLCRSPLAASVLAQRFADISEIRLHSAGTRAALGRPVPREAREIAGFMGAIDIRTHRARQVSEEMLSGSDVVLAMTREHRRVLVELNPRIVRRAFTIRELASLAALTTDEEIIRQGALPTADRVTRLRAAVEAAARRRSHRRSQDRPADDVIDPFGYDREIYALAALQLAPAIEGVAVLFQRALNLGDGR